jgi:hypothetical protein
VVLKRAVRHLATVAAVIVVAACGPRPLTEPAQGPSSAGEAADQLRIECHRDGSTAVAATEVAAHADGLHVMVDNRATEPVSVNGLATTRVPVAAPTWWQALRGPSMGYWTPSEPDCRPEAMTQSTIYDYTAKASGRTGDPVELFRQAADGLQPDDTVARGGYAKAAVAVVVVMRQDRVIAAARFTPARNGKGLTLGSYHACADAGVRV